MNCSSLQLESTALGCQTNRRSSDEPGEFQLIRRLLAERAIDLADLVEAISAVPRFALRLCQAMNDSGVECASVSDAAVLAGRAGIQNLLSECSEPKTPLERKRLEWPTRPRIVQTSLVKL